MNTLLFTGIGFVAGLFVATRCETVEKKVKMVGDKIEDGMENMIEEVSTTMKGLYECIMDISLNDVKETLIRHYKRIAREIKEFDYEDTKENMSKKYNSIKEKVNKLSKDVKNSMKKNKMA